MESSKNGAHTVLVSLILFAMTMLPAIALLIVAFTIWLSRVMDSAIWACVIVGAMFLLIATIIYFVWLQRSVKRVQEQIETVYETSRVIQSVLDWVNAKIATLRSWPH